MRTFLPNRAELLFFGLLSVLCAVLVLHAPAQDVWLSLLGMPVFFVAAMMGMRRRDRNANP